MAYAQVAVVEVKGKLEVDAELAMYTLAERLCIDVDTLRALEIDKIILRVLESTWQAGRDHGMRASGVIRTVDLGETRAITPMIPRRRG